MNYITSTWLHLPLRKAIIGTSYQIVVPKGETQAPYIAYILTGGTHMSDLFDKVTGQMDVFKKLASYIPGFNGYIERQNRRAADKLLRESVAARFEELWKRASEIQTSMVSEGMIALMDDMEQAAIKLRTFADKIRTASYGYAGFFDAVKIKEEELAQLYQYDLAFFDVAEQIGRALDNVEASMGDEEGLKAAIRNLVSLSREAVTTFDRRYEMINGSGQ